MTDWTLIVAAARREIGTRFHHQGRTPGVGVDCSGLVVVTMKAVGLPPRRDPTAYSRFPSRFDFLDHCRKNLDSIPLEDASSGDVLAFWIKRTRRGICPPQHMGFLDDPPTQLIHAYADSGSVVVHALDGYWRERTIAAFRIHGMQPCPVPGPFFLVRA